ncbi:MAG TPA: DUF5777 family beta-barrel protein [Mucilaginibacter sp.]|nr:DUF5777 family beta-barrel protein [Mucilaginibacter sp.]
MKRSIILLALMTLCVGLKAQTDTTKKAPGKTSSADSLMNSLSPDDKHQDVLPAFKATRLILSQTTTTVKKNNFNFLVIHRFGDMAGKAGGAQTLFGLDAVKDVYIGFEYGLSDNFNIDFGRSTIGQLVELGLKYAVLHQTSDNSSPVAITLFGQAGVRPYGPANAYNSFGDRLSYLGQVIISRKFSSAFSLQVLPTVVQDNTPYPADPGNEESFFALQTSARLKVTKRMSIIVDYSHSFSTFRTDRQFADPLGFGIEMETGGHVFTVNISNANAISAINTLSNTQSDFGRGQYRLGFTISRMFDFNKKTKHAY